MKPLASLARILALSALLSIAALAMFQDRLLYYPEKADVAALVALAGERFAPWPATGATNAANNFRGLIAEPRGEARGTLVVFHGNAGHAGHRGFYGELVDGLGLRLILAEYPGYGPRTGELGEENLVADAAATVELVRRDFGASGPLVLFGESLGAGVTAAASARVGHAGIAGIVLATPWDRLENVAAHHYPWLPRPLLSLFLRDRYDSVAHLAGWTGPSAVIVAERDGIVPAAFGQALFAALAGDKALRVVAGADHNDWMDRVGPGWWRETLAPMLSRPAPTRSAAEH